MSIEFAFSPVSYPAVTTDASDAQSDRAAVRGHAAGYAAGRQQADQEMAELRTSIEAERTAWADSARAELNSALRSLAEAAAQLRARELPLLAEVDRSLAEAAIELAEVIVGHELSDADGAARSAVRRALAQAGDEPATAVRLHPADLEVIRAEGGEFAALPLRPDPSLARGDAIVELAHGMIDARIGSTLARMRAALREGQL